jgi:2-iminobutanoate/2-iminopropanoate deaminase
MKREQIIPKGLEASHGPYAIGVKMGNTVFTTQIGTGADGELVPGGIKEQTRATLDNAKDVLTAVGATFDDIAKVTIYVTDMALVPEMNEVYREYFPADNFPARCCTCCAGMYNGAVVEMEFTAII